MTETDRLIGSHGTHEMPQNGEVKDVFITLFSHDELSTMMKKPNGSIYGREVHKRRSRFIRSLLLKPHARRSV